MTQMYSLSAFILFLFSLSFIIKSFKYAKNKKRKERMEALVISFFFQASGWICFTLGRMG